MVHRIRTIFKKYPFLLAGGLIFFICFLAYGQIMGMHFFLDDYLLLYALQHPNAYEGGPGLGVFGSDFGYSVTLFIPFFHIFGLKPEGYYLVEIALYFLAAITVYLFAKTLTGKKIVAFGTSLIFASGYVGSGSLYRFAVGWQNILAAIFLTLTATIYLKFVKSGSKYLYFLALAAFLCTIELSYYRSHGIILLILGIEIIFNFKIWSSIMRMLPFVLSYYYFYVYLLTSMDQGSKSLTFVQKIFTDRNFHYLLTPFKTLENLFLPDKFNFPLLVFIGILLSIFILKRSKILLYCLLFAIANYLVYFYVSPENPQETTHRYLTISFVGIATFWGVFLSGIFKNRNMYLFFCILIVTLNIGLARQEQLALLQNRSQPSKLFWQSFQSQVKQINKQSVIYIDSKHDGISKPARDVAVGSGSLSPSTSFAVYYGLKWEDIYLAENFPELLNLIKTGKVDRNNIHTFFYSRQNGLVNTTTDVKKALFSTSDRLNIDNPNKINLPFYSPAVLNFKTEIGINFSDIKYIVDQKLELSKYLYFLTSRDRSWNKVSATATTEVDYAEIRYIKDRDINTAWKGEDIAWSKNHKEEVVLNLGENRSVGAVRIIPGALGRIPTKYSYACSLDGNSWKEIKNFEKNVIKAETFTDKFNEENCAFIRLTVYGTVSDGPPQISEIEILDSEFTDLDLITAEQVETDPFKFIHSEEDSQEVFRHLNENGISGKICIYTDKYISSKPLCKPYKFKLGSNNGELLIDQGGTMLEKIEFLLPSQIKLTLEKIEIEYQTLDQLQNRGYIAKHTN